MINDKRESGKRDHGTY